MIAPQRLASWLWLPLVILALLVIYLPGLDNPLVFDDAYLADGSLVAEYSTLTELKARYLSYGSFAWVQHLFGEGWWKQRIVNLLIHIAVVVALWGFYREILARIVGPSPAEGGEAVPLERSPALGVAIAVFALNPVAVYAVAYLIQRSILLATLFVILGLWAFARGMARRNLLYHGAALACYVLAVASKEHAILAPLVALPLYVLVARPSARRIAVIASAVTVAMAGAAWILVARGYGAILGQAFDEFSRVYLLQLAQLNPDAPARAYPLSIMNQAWLFFEYGVRWMLPYTGWMSINLRPAFPLTFASFPQVLGLVGYLAVLGGGSFLLQRYRDWRALLGFTLLVPALLFATEFATVWVQDPFVLYRSYLWAIGIPGLVMCLLHGPSGRVMLAVGVAAGAVLTWQSLDRVLSMDSSERVWTDAITKLPNDPRAVGRWFPYLSRGNAYLEREELDLAITDFSNSSALGDQGMGSFNMGSVLAAKGRHPQALAAFERAQKQGYDLYNLPVQRGLSLAATNRGADAYAQFEAARALSPPSPTREVVLLNLGKLGLLLGKPEAAARLEELMKIDPRNKEGRYLLGMAYVTREDHARAEEVLSTLIAEQPSGPAYYARARANHGLKRRPEALADIEHALRADPRNAHLREWQARIQAMPGPR